MATVKNPVRRAERVDGLDRAATPVIGIVARLVRHRAVRNLLRGTWLGPAARRVVGRVDRCVVDGGVPRAADTLAGVGVAVGESRFACGRSGQADCGGEVW